MDIYGGTTLMCGVCWYAATECICPNKRVACAKTEEWLEKCPNDHEHLVVMIDLDDRTCPYGCEPGCGYDFGDGGPDY